MINTRISDYTISVGVSHGKSRRRNCKDSREDNGIIEPRKKSACLDAHAWDGSNWLAKGSRLTSAFFKSGKFLNRLSNYEENTDVTVHNMKAHGVS
jgi:hypothetical protein